MRSNTTSLYAEESNITIFKLCMFKIIYLEKRAIIDLVTNISLKTHKVNEISKNTQTIFINLRANIARLFKLLPV